ncbi:MAG: hypothetical protein ACN2B6_06260 [Rickettsiales bacterium]
MESIHISKVSYTSISFNQQNDRQIVSTKDTKFGDLLDEASAKADKQVAEVSSYALIEASNIMQFIDELFDNIQASLQQQLTGASSGSVSASLSGGQSFGFTSEFTSVFGSSGPLINWINNTTSSLGLSKEQNLALQQISIDFKDTRGSVEDRAQISEALKAAGITA